MKKKKKFLPATKSKEQYLQDFEKRNLDLALGDGPSTVAP